jgi:hypothetical protein
MSHLDNLKQTLYHHRFIQSRQEIPAIAEMMQSVIDKVIQEILLTYKWTDEDIKLFEESKIYPDAIREFYPDDIKEFYPDEPIN